MTTPTGNYYCTLTNSGANLVSQAISNTTQVWYAYAEIQETSAGSQPTLVEQFYNNYVTLGSNTQLDATGSVYGIDNSEITVLPYTGNNTSEFIITVPSWLPTDTAGNSYNYNSFFVYAGFQKTVETGLTSTGGIVNLTGLSSPYSIYVNATEYGTQNVITLTTLSSNALNSVDYPINLYYVDGGDYIVAGTVDATNPNAVIITLDYDAIPTTIIGTPYVIYATNLCLFAVGCNNTGYIKFPTYQSSAGNIFNMQITIQSSNLAPDQVSSFTVNTIANYAASAVQVGSVAAIQSVAGITGSQGSTLANNYITQSVDPQGNNVSAKLFYSSTALPENGVNLWNFDRYDLIDKLIFPEIISHDETNTYIQVDTFTFFRNLNFSQSINITLNGNGSGNFILQVPGANLSSPGLATGCRFFYVPVETITNSVTTLVVQDPNFYDQISLSTEIYIHNFSENNNPTIVTENSRIIPEDNFFFEGSEIVIGIFENTGEAGNFDLNYTMSLLSDKSISDSDRGIPTFLNFTVQGVITNISPAYLNVVDLGSSISSDWLSSTNVTGLSTNVFFNEYLSFQYYYKPNDYGVLTLKTLKDFGVKTDNPVITDFCINSSSENLLIFQNLIGKSFTRVSAILPDLVNTSVNLFPTFCSDYNTTKALGSISSYSVSTADNGSLIYNTYPTSCTYSLPAYSSVPLGFTVCITNLVGIISDGTHSVTMTAGTYNKYFKCEAGLDGWYIENQNIVSYSPWATESYVNSYVSAAAAFTYAGAFTIVAGNLEQGQYVGAATTMSLSALITLNKYAASCDVNAFWSQLYGGTGGISLNVVTTYGPSIYTAPSGSGGVTYAQCGVPAGINWAAVGGFSGIQGGTFLAQNYNQIGGNNSVQGSGTVTGYNVRLSTLSVRDLEEIAARVRMEEALLSNPTSFNIYGDYFGVELNTDYSDDEHFIVWLRNNGNFNTYSATLSAGILSPLSVIVETLEQAKQAAKNTLSIAYSNTQNSGYNSDSLTALIPGSFNDLTKYIALQSYLNSKSLSSYSNFMLFNGSTTTITITQLNEVIAEVGTWETELNIQYEAYLAEIDACTTNEDCSALIFNFSQNIV